jgi:ElaB/YqjD/DUF883 family membrane-anchored ribosome-binding protein
MAKTDITQTELQRSRDKLMADFNAVVVDAETLLKSLASEGGEKAQELRAKAEERLVIAKERLSEIEQSLGVKAKAAAEATEAYVQEHPWQTIGIAAGLGVLVGLLLNRR